MALTTLMSVKTQGGILPGDTSRDQQFRLLIDAVSSLVKLHLNRDLEAQTYVEYYSGNGSPILMLHQFPVTSVSQVCVDDSGYFGAAPNGFDAALNLTDGVDYALMSGVHGTGSSGCLRRIGTVWHRPPSRARGVLQNLPGIPSGNIKVEYTAGFDVIPPAIASVVNSLVLKQAAQAAIGTGASQMSYEGASVGYFSPSEAAKVLGGIEHTLAGYRSIPI